MDILVARALSHAYGQHQVLREVNLNLAQGSRHAVIGLRGAGKTTLLDALSGVLRPAGGKIELDGQDISRTTPQQRIKFGIARAFQGGALFPQMTPLDCISLALSEHKGLGRHWWRAWSRDTVLREEANEALSFLNLWDVYDHPTSMLSEGKLALLELGLALARDPRVLLLDGLLSGLAREDVRELLRVIAALPAEVSIVLAERELAPLTQLADRVSLMAHGTLVAQGSAEEVAAELRFAS